MTTRDFYEWRDQQAAEKLGVSVEKYQEQQRHEAKMKLGKQYYEEKQDKEALIQYYLQHI